MATYRTVFKELTKAFTDAGWTVTEVKDESRKYYDLEMTKNGYTAEAHRGSYLAEATIHGPTSYLPGMEREFGERARGSFKNGTPDVRAESIAKFLAECEVIASRSREESLARNAKEMREHTMYLAGVVIERDAHRSANAEAHQQIYGRAPRQIEVIFGKAEVEKSQSVYALCQSILDSRADSIQSRVSEAREKARIAFDTKYGVI